MSAYDITYDSSAVSGDARANLWGRRRHLRRRFRQRTPLPAAPAPTAMTVARVATDAISYGNETGGNGVNVDIAAGTGTDTYGNVETFVNIDKIWGSQYDDTMYGDASNNLFEGRAGNDYMDGRDGIDTAWYRSEVNFGGVGGVNVNLTSGIGLDSFGNTDTLVNIESVAGTDSADVLVGDNNDNDFQGFAGNDSFNGMGGSDAVSFQDESGGTGAVVNLALGTRHRHLRRSRYLCQHRAAARLAIRRHLHRQQRQRVVRRSRRQRRHRRRRRLGRPVLPLGGEFRRQRRHFGRSRRRHRHRFLRRHRHCLQHRERDRNRFRRHHNR